MSTKQQALKARKQAKANARSKAKQKARRVAEQKFKELETSYQAEMKRRALLSQVSQDGILATAKKLQHHRDFKKPGAAPLTNRSVVEGISEIIPQLTGLHGALEVSMRLVSENKLTLTEDQQNAANSFDKGVVQITEDINAIYELIDFGKQPEDYIDIFIHYLNTIAEIFDVFVPVLFEGVFKPNEKLIEEYVKEHTSEGENHFTFSMRVHADRMLKIAPLYRTRKPTMLDEELATTEEVVVEEVDETELSNGIYRPVLDMHEPVDAEVIEVKE